MECAREAMADHTWFYDGLHLARLFCRHHRRVTLDIVSLVMTNYRKGLPTYQVASYYFKIGVKSYPVSCHFKPVLGCHISLPTISSERGMQVHSKMQEGDRIETAACDQYKRNTVVICSLRKISISILGQRRRVIHTFRSLALGNL